VDGTPVLVVTDVWRYPYPRRRGLVGGDSTAERLASPGALFDLSAALAAVDPTVPASREAWAAAAEARRTQALAWARANGAEREREPVRALVREAALSADWAAASRQASRLRGTYRVTLEAGDARGVWYFRTHDRPGYPWRGRDSVRTTADLLASPYTAGYRLVGYAAATADSLTDIEAACAARRAAPARAAGVARDRRTARRSRATRRAGAGRVLEFNARGRAGGPLAGARAAGAADQCRRQRAPGANGYAPSAGQRSRACRSRCASTRGGPCGATRRCSWADDRCA
jgi:hypothetical protein